MDPYIKTYEPSDAESIAQMWNESDEGWPGGFTGGVPFTAERIRQWLSEDKYIDVFLVIADNRVAAYCSVYEYAMEPSAAYVALLNCHPRYWKNGFGRDLLRKAVARSAELGYKRLDLHTWPGNLRAVPLYKKTGFFWQPETSVHMLNYLPLILPLAKDFFGDADWYKLYQRELKQEEDDITWNGLKVFPYTFQNNGRILRAIVDRESRGLTAFETDDFSVACLPESQELIAGVASHVRWEIVNKTPRPLPASLLATGESGVNVYKNATVEVRDRAVIEGEVMVERDIIAHDKEEPAHKITSTIVVGGRLLVLETGVRPKQAVEVAAGGAYIGLTPGLPHPVHLRLRNNLKQPVRARLALMPPEGVSIDQTQHTIDLPAEGLGGVSCAMQAAGAGALSVVAAVTVERGDEVIAVKPASLPVAAPAAGKPAAYLRQDEVVLENESARVVVSLKGAAVNVYRKEIGLALVFQRAALGPPFYPNEFRAVRFAARLEEKAGAVSAILSAASRQHAGVTFERVFTLDSSHILTVGHRLYNTGGKEHTFQVSIVHFSQFGETSIALPLAAGVVVDMMPSFPDLFDEESHKPETLSETWMCLDGDGFALGVIWQDPKEQEIDGWVRPSLKLNLPVLPPYGRAEAAPLYIYAGPGNWRAVRAIWRRLVKPDAPAHVEPRRAIEAATVPSPLVVLDGKSDTLLRVDNQRTRALAGNVTVSAPDGWSIAPAEGEFTSVRRGKPFDLAIAVRRGRGKGPGAAEGSVTVRHDLAEERFPLPLVALGRRAGVDLTEYQEQGQRLVKIDNGFMRLAVAPDFLGSVVSLEHNGVNHLFSSFPTARAFSWMTPWHGGVSAVLHALDDEDIGPGNPGRMWLESWGYQLVRPRRGAAIPWTGVRLVSDLTRDKLRGLRLEMDYLTVGQSNLLAVVARLVNVTAAPFSGMLVTQAYVQPGGEREKVELYDVERRRIRRMRDQIWGASSGQWAAVAHSASGLCLALVGGKGSGQVSALDFGLDGAHLYDIAVPTLKPHATYEMVSYLVLTPDVEQARLYRWLERWEWAGM